MTVSRSRRRSKGTVPPPVVFPGDQGGFIGQPDEFAKTLRKVLTHAIDLPDKVMKARRC